MALTNEDILKLMESRGQAATTTAMDLARASERELLGIRALAGVNLSEILDGVRADERKRVTAEFFSTPKEEGTKFWVSWDSKQNERPPLIDEIHSSPYISSTRPILINLDNGLICWDLGRDCTAITEIDSDLAALLGVKHGECKAFFIREAADGGD